MPNIITAIIPLSNTAAHLAEKHCDPRGDIGAKELRSSIPRSMDIRANNGLNSVILEMHLAAHQTTSISKPYPYGKKPYDVQNLLLQNK
jgi:hypothetical protein